jgi:NitT/TauT family transport system substrate-binding protein
LVDITQQINSNKTAAAQVLNAELKKTTGKALPEAVLMRALERVEFTWDPLAESLRRCAESAHKVGFAKSSPDLTGIYWLRPLNEVLKKKGLPPVRD